MNANDYATVLRYLPGCHYVSENGQLLFMSEALDQLLGHNDPPKLLADLFPDDGERDHTFTELKCHPERVSSGALYLSKGDGASLYVKHQARIISVSGNPAAEIIIGTVTPLESDFALRQEIDVYRRLLNRLKAGVHVLDFPREGEVEPRISWMNDFEAKLLRLDTSRISQVATEVVSEPLYPSDLVVPEEDTKREVIKSVLAKFSGNRPPTVLRPREFCEKGPDGENKRIPVRIQDYFIASNPRKLALKRPSRIITLVLPCALPSKLVRFLTEKGARAPVLDELGVRSFEKYQMDKGHPIRFRFLNKLFRQENRPNDADWQRLQARKGVRLHSENPNDDLIWDQLIDEVGLTDSDLYPIEIADRFNADDIRVIESGPLEGFEPHPKAQSGDHEEQHSEVQFLKIPLIENGVVVGLSGFYWPIEEMDKKADSIVDKLLHSLEKEREQVLDDLPDLFHVIRKNAEKKFVFVNRRQAREHEKAPSEFMGKTDTEVFEFDKTLAKNYEKDDETALGGNVVARYEPHRSSATAAVRQVLTIKSPIHGLTGKPNGVQCIYWYSDEMDDLLRETRITDGVAAPSQAPDAKAQLFVSYARKNRSYLVGAHSDSPRISGLEETLKVLQNLHQIRYWFDEHRREDVLDPEIGKQINLSRIFVLLLSPAFFESNYIRDVELPLIQSRRLNDPSVRILPILLQSVDYRDSDHQIVAWLRSIPAFNEGNGEWKSAVEALINERKESEFWSAVSKRIRSLLSGDVNS